MSEDFRWWCGFDWASEKHHVWLLDATGRRLGERDVEHGGAGLGELCDWLIETTGGAPGEIAIAIETSSGPVVEMFLERGFPVFSLNPKQLDRFRDRFSVAGAKDDSRDSRVLADSLRTDRGAEPPGQSAARAAVALLSPGAQARRRRPDRGVVPGAVASGADAGQGRQAAQDHGRAHPCRAPHPPLGRGTCARRSAPEAADGGARRHRGRERPHSSAAAAHPPGERSDQGRASPSRRALRQARSAGGDRAGARVGSTATRRSCGPCRESEGSSSPRCSPRRRSLCGDEITTRCALCPVRRPSPAAAASPASFCAATPATSAWPKPSITGRVSPLSMTRSAANVMRNCASAATVMAGRCARSAIACSSSPAPCSSAASSTIPITRATKQQPHETTHPFVRPSTTIPPSRPGSPQSTARRGGQGWPTATAPAARSVLDGPEHGADLAARRRGGYRPRRFFS
jgi:hypothetical protein